MLLHITNKQMAAGNDPFISVDAITQMVKNFVTNTHKWDAINQQSRTMNTDLDGYCIWYPIDEINQLIKDNEDTTKKVSGIRVYLGMHGYSDIEKREMPNRPEQHLGQHTAILVATTQNTQGEHVDLLERHDSVSLVGTGACGMGADEGQIAPPPRTIPGSKIILE